MKGGEILGIYTVSEVARYLKNALDDDPILANLMVRGEISNFKRHYSGHCYFTLKDANASLRAVLFRGRAQFLKFQPENGMKVVAGGNLSVFERDGQVQLYVSTLLPEGAGALSVAFAQLKEKLAAEGLFDAARKRPLPFYPRRIGVVTSASGAVLRDIYKVAKRRNPAVALRLYPVQVQGAEAAGQIAAALRFFNERDPVDALIVGRGGGSMEDLWAFNEEIVVRAVSASKIPVVSAVGHETDFTLTDFAADVRAATPSQAAELVVPNRRELLRRVQAAGALLEAKARGVLEAKRRRLAACLARRAIARPQLLLGEKRQALDYAADRLARARAAAVQERRGRLLLCMEKLELLSPLEALKRGYAIASSGGEAVRSVKALRPRQALRLILADGSAGVTVTDVREGRAEDALFDTEENDV